MLGLSLAAESEGTSLHCGTQASHCMASLIVEHRLTARGLRWLQPVGLTVAAQGL